MLRGGRLTGRATLVLSLALLFVFSLVLSLSGCDALANIGAPSHTLPAKSFTVKSPVTAVVIQGGSGSISVTGSAAPDVVVVQQTSYAKTPPSATHVLRGTTLTVTYTCPVELVCGVSYNVRVPRGVSVSVSAGTGSITLTGLTGPVSARADAGLITAVSLGSATASFTSSAGGVIATFSVPPRSVSVSTHVGPITLTVPGTVAYKISTHTFVGTSTITVPRSARSAHVIDASSDLGSIAISPE
jgi:hypothetical protein